MAKGWAEAIEDELRPKYDLGQLRGGVHGKYYRQAKSGTNLALVESDLAKAFPDETSVNKQRGAVDRRATLRYSWLVWRLRCAADLQA